MSRYRQESVVMGLTSILGFVLASLAGTAYAQGDGYYGSDNQGDGYVVPPDGGSGYGLGYGEGSGSVFPSFDIDEVIRTRSLHGWFAAGSFLLFPVGAIYIRAFSTRHSWAVHAVTQCAALVLYLIAAGLGIKLIDTIRLPPDGTSLLQLSSINAHPIMGFVVLAALLVQPQLGCAHHGRFKRLRRRTWLSHAHIWVGRAAVTLGMINGGLGLYLAGASLLTSVVYATLAVVSWLLWLGAAFVDELYRREKRREAVPRPTTAAAAAAAHDVRVASPPARPAALREEEGEDEPTLPRVATPDPVPLAGGRRHFQDRGRDRDRDRSIDPTPPYSPRHASGSGGPPVYGDSVEMMPMKSSSRSSETPWRGGDDDDGDSW
ncbi:hypothetical protein F4818DRAFT_453951 [Hypoxylon cercidicola]|nr:hypothetical protein F4818DRAFT_453951 [Hypoxylon cercidicola]